MANNNSESIFSKITVGVCISVFSTMILVYFGFQMPEHSANKRNNHQDTEVKTVLSNEPPGFQPTVFGKYTGRCYNETAGIGSEVILTIDQEANGKVSGNINILGALSGSGRFEGFLEGNELSFTTVESATDISISWMGIVKDRNISGRYFVSMPTMQKMYGNTDQYGVWEVTK